MEHLIQEEYVGDLIIWTCTVPGCKMRRVFNMKTGVWEEMSMGDLDVCHNFGRATISVSPYGRTGEKKDHDPFFDFIDGLDLD